MKASKLRPPGHLRRPPANGDDADLAASIRRFGVLQPIVIRPSGEVIIGARRARAADPGQDLPVIVKDVDEVDALTLRLSDEFSRRDMPWPVKAEAIAELQRLLERRGERVTLESLGKRLGVSQRTVADYYQVVKLPEKVKHLGQEGDLSLHAAREIARSDKLTTDEKAGLARKFSTGALKTTQAHEVVEEAEKLPPKYRQALARIPSATLQNVREAAKREEQRERMTKEEQATRRVLGVWIRLRDWAKKGADSFKSAFVELAPTVAEAQRPRLRAELVRLRNNIDEFLQALEEKPAKSAGAVPLRIVAEAEGQPIFAELIEPKP